MPRPEAGVPELVDRIAGEIRRQGPVSFARFMELALYDPDWGYYARGADRLGPGGDFFTASDVGSAFGACVERQLAEIDGLLGTPDPFTVVEHGAGRGLLARDIIDAARAEHPGLASRLRYRIVDVSPAMREAASRQVPEAEISASVGDRDRAVGCAIAVELFDALPVHRLRRRGDRLVEVRVALDRDGGLIETEGEVDPEPAVLGRRYGAAPEDGDEAEVCPLAERELERMAGSIERGLLIVVDYGYPARELYSRRHNRGTLLAYSKHATSERLLDRVGEQDLTAHVNFTQLEDHARELGLAVLGRTTQDRFLIALGILERFRDDDPSRWSDPDRVRERLRAMTLLHPDGMGRRFHVLLFAKGIAGVPDPTGLHDPFAR